MQVQHQLEDVKACDRYFGRAPSIQQELVECQIDLPSACQCHAFPQLPASIDLCLACHNNEVLLFQVPQDMVLPRIWPGQVDGSLELSSPLQHVLNESSTIILRWEGNDELD